MENRIQKYNIVIVFWYLCGGMKGGDIKLKENLPYHINSKNILNPHLLLLTLKK